MSDLLSHELNFPRVITEYGSPPFCIKIRHSYLPVQLTDHQNQSNQTISGLEEETGIKVDEFPGTLVGKSLVTALFSLGQKTSLP